jgi:hypothetical protein
MNNRCARTSRANSIQRRTRRINRLRRRDEAPNLKLTSASVARYKPSGRYPSIRNGGIAALDDRSMKSPWHVAEIHYTNEPGHAAGNVIAVLNVTDAGSIGHGR